MPGVKMCPVCRGSKQKCTPADRVWIPGGRQDKCERCTQFKHECGPHEYPPVRSRAPRSSAGRASQSSSGSSQAPIAVPPPSVPQRVDAPDDLQDKQELRRRLRALEMQFEATEKLQLALDYLVNSERQTENLYSELFSARNAHVRILTLQPPQAEALADRLAGRGEIEAAEAAYIRILNVFRAFQKLGIKAWHETRSLLKKLADMLWNNGDPIRAEKLVWEALSLRDVPANAQSSDLELLKSLARSIPKTCLDIWNSNQSGDGAAFPPYCPSLYPPLQGMMQSPFALAVSGSPFHRGEFSEPAMAPSEPAILGGMETVMEFLRAFPPDALDVRDIHGRTPLYLACALGMEGLGRGILRRLAEVSRVCTQTHLNNRDSAGQTILGAAIIGCCSSQYIGFLLASGAQADPDQLLRVPLTPLQAAAMSGSSDIVRLLLDNKAQPDRVYRGNETPLALAEECGHVDVVQQLRNASTGNARPTLQIGWNPG